MSYWNKIFLHNRFFSICAYKVCCFVIICYFLYCSTSLCWSRRIWNIAYTTDHTLLWCWSCWTSSISSLRRESSNWGWCRYWWLFLPRGNFMRLSLVDYFLASVLCPCKSVIIPISFTPPKPALHAHAHQYWIISFPHNILEIMGSITRSYSVSFQPIWCSRFNQKFSI